MDGERPNSPSARVVLGAWALGLTGATCLVLVGLDARPIADDWWFITDARHEGFLSYMGKYLASSGRFSQFALAWLSARLFGTAAVNVIALGLLVLAVALAAWALRAVALLRQRSPAPARELLLAVMAVVATFASAPSLYDTIGWFAASVVYVAAVVAMLAIAAVVLNDLSGRSGPLWPVAVSVGVLACAEGGFNEIVGAVTILACLLALLSAHELCDRNLRRRSSVTLAATATGALVGTLVNVFGPGSQARASAQGAHVSIAAAAQTAVNNLSFLRSDAHDGVFLLAVGTGVLAYQVLGPVDGAPLRRWTAAWTLFLMSVPWLVTSCLTAWGGSTESGDRSPFRAAFIATGAFAMGLALAVVLALSMTRVSPRRRAVELLGLVALCAGTLCLLRKAAPLIRAENMRIHALALRASAIRREVYSQLSTVTVTPAPLLTVLTQAYDLSFAPTSQQRSGWLSGFKTMSGIPTGVAVRVVAQQPRSYCLPGVSAPWVGVESCQQLDAQRR